ncbi:Rab proteins geranylgeranyltransferase component A [Babesia sp. Xinjiang]|uniref:Rab proteins geranylgeranyltransferase component A n=1 Tax=Babesia sp. Xinjiang TaxID=462227 RepID=UPI000A261ECA|nr:Rab proteins geranylgeranyltransferase component A [Babesia sp. Xinjiang]ORM41040.1 Rab proteins geranylgeranyltransferase component A [Babesia sp. Xinjiang]
MDTLDVDVVVTGTGITGAIVAACLAYTGRKVLQIDKNQCYGQANRTLSIKQLLEAPEVKCLNTKDDLKTQFNIIIGNHDDEILENQQVKAHDSQRLTKETKFKRLMELMNIMYNKVDTDPAIVCEFTPFTQQGTNAIQALDHFCAESSKYALDVWPKMIFGRSAEVDMLLNSGGHSYIHFTETNGPILYGHEPALESDGITLQDAPNNRNAICRSKLLSPLEKRTLMQMLTNLTAGQCITRFESLALKGSTKSNANKNNENADNITDPDTNWLEFLNANGCTQNTVELLSHGICLGGADVKTWTKREGLQRLLKYAQSIGIYGQSESPFIYPMYGTGDVVQAFTRVGAVLGVTFMLGTSVVSVTKDEQNKMTTLQLTNGMTINTKMIIMDDKVTAGPAGITTDSMKETKNTEQHKRRLHVLTLVIDQPILPGLNMAVIVPQSNLQNGMSLEMEPVYLIQAGADIGAAAENKYVFYIMTIDVTPMARFDSFAQCDHPTVRRLMQIYNTMAEQETNESLKMHRGWLADDHVQEIRDGNGIVILPRVKATPVVPLVEEIPVALTVVNALLGKEDVHITPYYNADLTDYLHIVRSEDSEDNAMDATAEKLQSIIDKYG